MTSILFVYHVSSIGGGSFCLLNLLKAIDRTIFEPTVLLPRQGPLCDEIEKLGIKIVYYPSLTLYPYNKTVWKFRTLRQFFKMLRCLHGFGEVVKNVNPHIVYFNTMMLFPFLKIAKSNGCKTTLHVREHWPLNEHTIQLGWAQKTIYKYVDCLLAINHYSASIFPAEESTIIYDWIDMESRRGGPQLQELLKNDRTYSKVYLFTGGVDPIKGTREVISTFSKIIKGDDRRLLCLGCFPNEAKGIKGIIKKILNLGKKSYVERIKELCLSDDRVIFVPSNYKITDLMEQVDGFISYFTIPHANLALSESIIVGLPSIAARTEESLEYSDNGKGAALFNINNIDEFTKMWVELDSDNYMFRNKALNTSVTVAYMFEKKRNAELFNKTLISMCHNK